MKWNEKSGAQKAHAEEHCGAKAENLVLPIDEQHGALLSGIAVAMTVLLTSFKLKELQVAFEDNSIDFSYSKDVHSVMACMCVWGLIFPHQAMCICRRGCKIPSSRACSWEIMQRPIQFCQKAIGSSCNP